MQNKVYYAVYSQTAAELIFNRADAEKEFMGLMTFPGVRPHLKDLGIVKNCLDDILRLLI